MAIGPPTSTLLGHSIWRPFRARRSGWSVPRVETLGFYEADFVKARRENCFLFIFASFWPTSDNNSPLALLVA
jgi:hypothetical protein